MDKVLLIEDDENLRELMQCVIQQEGFAAITASDGQEGLELFKKEKPHIVVTDIKMPKVDGMEVLHTVKRVSPLTEVILMTGYGSCDTVAAAVREGAADFLKKPIALDDLAESLMRSKGRLSAAKEIFATPAILLAEDDRTVRETLTRVFAKERWNVLAVSDGEKALQIFNETKIDIIVADIKMPYMDGITLLREVRQRTADCEVIVITGYGDEDTAIAAMRHGAINYIKKPINLEELIVSIEKALETLYLRRCMLYRSQEAALGQEVIVKILTKNKLVVDAKRAVNGAFRKNALDLLESLPIELLVLGQDGTVLYANPYLSDQLGFKPEAVDKNLTDGLAAIGFEDVVLENFSASIESLFSSEAQDIGEVSLGKNSICYTRMSYMGIKQVQEAVLLLL